MSDEGDLKGSAAEAADEEAREEETGEEEEEKTEVSPEVLAGWCDSCMGRCCRYYTVVLDKPEDADDFDELRWFLAHGGCYLYIDEGDWHLNVEVNCRFLAPDGRCLIYRHRPGVCRDFGREEECEWTGEFDFERMFKTIPELEAFAKEVLAPEELAKLPVFPKGWKGPV